LVVVGVDRAQVDDGFDAVVGELVGVDRSADGVEPASDLEDAEVATVNPTSLWAVEVSVEFRR
jgi:hypothetical protein